MCGNIGGWMQKLRSEVIVCECRKRGVLQVNVPPHIRKGDMVI